MKISITLLITFLSLNLWAKEEPSFFVDSVTSFISPLAVNSLQLAYKKLISLEVCLKSTSDYMPIRDGQFLIHSLTTKSTDSSNSGKRGCIQWEEVFQYDPLDNEKIFALHWELKSTQNDVVDLKLNYNPWQDRISFPKN